MIRGRTGEKVTPEAQELNRKEFEYLLKTIRFSEIDYFCDHFIVYVHKAFYSKYTNIILNK